jgi:hypothetical protein
MQSFFRSFCGIALTGFAVALSGCGEFSYKRGASAADYQTAKQQCEKQFSVAAEIDQCLQQQGWLVVSADKPLMGRNAATLSPENTISAEIAPLDETADPFETVTISSWWKMGAGPEVLMQQGQDCVEKLGEGHQASANMSLVSRGVLACMGEKGWFAVSQ